MHSLRQRGAGNGEQKPVKRIERADLPQQIARHDAVIPDIPAEPEVDDNAAEKLQ